MNIRTLFHRLSAPRCLLCQGAKGPLCEACRGDLPWLPAAHCPVCALPTPDGETCGHCLREPPAFERTTALFSYDFPIDRLIQRLKYHEQLALAPLLAGLLADAVQAPPDLWLPMPLHANRIRQRGFNQAVEIGRELARLTSVPMRVGLASRERDTPPQAGLKRAARRRNMRGAFACKADLSGLHVGIVDDVMTTGSTLDALASALRQAGARKVSCVVVARA